MTMKVLRVAMVSALLLAGLGCGLPPEGAPNEPGVAQADLDAMVTRFFHDSAQVKTEAEFREFVKTYPNITLIRRELARRQNAAQSSAQVGVSTQALPAVTCARILDLYFVNLGTNDSLAGFFFDSYFRNGCGN